MMPKVLDPAKKLTDEVAIRHLTKQGKIAENWEFWHDYGSHYDAQGNKRKEWSPFAKFYRNTDNPRERMMVVSGLPMVDENGLKNVPKWEASGGSGKFKEKNNLFKATIDGAAVTLVVRNDQPTGIPKNARLDFSPQLFLNGVELIGSTPVLLPVDPKNSNYLENTLEWDYGVCKRHFRQVEGRVHGYWIFAANPGGDIRIKYNQSGDYRLKLGQYQQTDDTEFIPQAVFALASYPFEVHDSATYYPDTDSAGVDGYTEHFENLTWAGLRGSAGNYHDNTVNQGSIYYNQSSGSSPNWTRFNRTILVIPTNGLPDTAIISVATLSVRGFNKVDTGGVASTVNIFASTPASNTVLADGDFAQVGTTAFCDTPVTYANWSIVAYNDFVFNATGLAAVSLTTVSKFSAYDADHDAANSAPTWPGASKYNQVQGYFAEQGTGYKPKLVVTYTVPSPAQKHANMAAKLMTVGAM